MPAVAPGPSGGDRGLTTAFVIETSRITAGIVTGERSGFRFHAAHPSMTPLDGTVYRTPGAAQRAAEHLAHLEDARGENRKFKRAQ